jgi:hypothetical protein
VLIIIKIKHVPLGLGTGCNDDNYKKNMYLWGWVQAVMMIIKRKCTSGAGYRLLKL